MKDKIIALLGLARRANRIVLGETILETLSKGKIHFIFVANNASEKTKERYLKKCHYYHLNYCLDFSSAELAVAIGRNNVKTIGIIDEGFSKAINKELEGGCNYGETSEEENK